jgi:hypothetical protein
MSARRRGVTILFIVVVDNYINWLVGYQQACTAKKIFFEPSPSTVGFYVEGQ